jgi:hypothetical protein
MGSGERKHLKGGEQQPHRAALDYDCQDDLPIRNVRRPTRHLPIRVAEHQQSYSDQKPCVDPVRQTRSHYGGHEATKPTWRHNQPRSFHRVIAQDLEPWGHQCQTGHHENADHEHQQDAGRKVESVAAECGDSPPT